MAWTPHGSPNGNGVRRRVRKVIPIAGILNGTNVRLRCVLDGTIGHRMTSRGKILSSPGGRVAGTQHRRRGDKNEKTERERDFVAHENILEGYVCVIVRHVNAEYVPAAMWNTATTRQESSTGILFPIGADVLLMALRREVRKRGRGSILLLSSGTSFAISAHDRANTRWTSHRSHLGNYLIPDLI
jgi:hypothetical protein